MTDTVVAELDGAAEVTVLDDYPLSSLDQQLRTLRAEAIRLVDEVAGQLKHVALRTGDCAVELTWADPLPAMVGATDAVAPPVEPGAAPAADPADTFAVVAPLVGVFYVAPSPGANPFVRPGDRVGANQIVGIVEAMKLMNEITSGVAGIVTEVLVADGQPVEFGQELVRLRLDPEPAEA